MLVDDTTHAARAPAPAALTRAANAAHGAAAAAAADDDDDDGKIDVDADDIVTCITTGPRPALARPKRLYGDI